MMVPIIPRYTWLNGYGELGIKDNVHHTRVFYHRFIFVFLSTLFGLEYILEVLLRIEKKK